MPVDSTENNAKKTSKSMKWLTSKLHSHHIDRGKTQQDKLSSQTGTRQVSAPGNGPVNHELNHIKQHVASVQRGSRQTLVREIAIAKAKSESQSRSLLRRKKPPQNHLIQLQINLHTNSCSRMGSISHQKILIKERPCFGRYKIRKRMQYDYC